MRVALMVVSLGVAFGGALVACDARADDVDETIAVTIPGESVTVPVDSSDIAASIPTAQFSGEPADSPAPLLGSQDAAGGAAEPRAGFSPDPADADFCAAVAAINSRPQPRDEYEEVVVANHYFLAIEPYVPLELEAEFALVLEFTSTVVENGSFTETDELPDSAAVSTAIDTINVFVDGRCLGLT